MPESDHRLVLAEPRASGEQLVESAGSQRLGYLRGQVAFPARYRRPGPQPGPLAHADRAPHVLRNDLAVPHAHLRLPGPTRANLVLRVQASGIASQPTLPVAECSHQDHLAAGG